MQFALSSFSRRLFKPLAFSLALLSLVFFLQLVPHSHAKSHDEAACRICQVGHIGVTPAISAISLSVPLVTFGQVAPAAKLTATQNHASHSSSRAPPADLLS